MPDNQNEPKTAVSKDPPTPNEAGVEPSGYRGNNPSTAGPGETGVRSGTPENQEGHLNPSSPEDSNTTPGSVSSK